MKIILDVHEIILSVNGREMTFSEKELVSKLEKLEELERKAESVQKGTEVTKKTDTEQSRSNFEVAETPTEGKCFEVNPKEIIDHQELFQKKRNDPRQENKRKLILEAIIELKKNPERYGKNFKTMFPKKTWDWKTVEQLEEMACILGDHETDWVEQFLEWAQRIVNGETWEAICNAPDTAQYYRLIKWKNGHHRIVGGASERLSVSPASAAYNMDYYSSDRLDLTVPSVVLYDE